MKEQRIMPTRVQYEKMLWDARVLYEDLSELSVTMITEERDENGDH